MRKPKTLADALDVSADTEKRQRDELLEKGYLEPTGRRRGRATEYRLLRGEVEVYRLRSPQTVGRDPQSAGHIEESRSEERGQKASLSSDSRRAAASPSPAGAGSAAVEDEETPKRRKTGWRFVRSTASGTYVRDPEGMDRLPPGYFAPPERTPQENLPPLPELEPEEVRLQRAAELREWAFERWGAGRPRGEPAGGGFCGDCRRNVVHRECHGQFELCAKCISHRHAVATRPPSRSPQPRRRRDTRAQ